MDDTPASRFLEPDEVAAILDNLASLMEDLHRSDEALQTALSSLANGSDAAPTLFELQHVDLLTQSHFDVSKLVRVLANWARGKPTSREDLTAALTLRSLQDKLVDHCEDAKIVEAGELSLF